MQDRVQMNLALPNRLRHRAFLSSPIFTPKHKVQHHNRFFRHPKRYGHWSLSRARL